MDVSKGDEEKEISVMGFLAKMDAKSTEWRKENDFVTEQFRISLMEEVGALKTEIKAIKTTVTEHSLDIAYVNDLKKKAGWGISAMKFLAWLSGWCWGLVIAYHLVIEFVKEHFNYFKHG